MASNGQGDSEVKVYTTDTIVDRDHPEAKIVYKGLITIPGLEKHSAQENRRFSIHRRGSRAFKLRYALRMTNFTMSIGDDAHENVMDFGLTGVHLNAS